MPYADPEKQKEYMRDYARKNRELLKKLKEKQGESPQRQNSETPVRTAIS